MLRSRTFLFYRMDRRPRRACCSITKIIQADASDCDALSDSSGGEFVPETADDGDISEQSSDESGSESEDLSLLTLANLIQKDKLVRNKNANGNVTHSDESNDDEIPLSVLRQRTNDNEKRNEPPSLKNDKHLLCNSSAGWQNGSFCPPVDTGFKGSLEQPPADSHIESPYIYFRKMIANEMLENLAKETNLYAMQKEGSEIDTIVKELEILIGIYIRMGLVSMPRVRAYWELETRYSPISDKMSRNRFEKLTANLHFTNNLTVTDKQKEDKLWKIRPWLAALRAQFLKIPSEENNSVDEIMVPFKGKSNIKQYIRGKPNPWGFKLWGRAGTSGILYDFDVYQGKSGRQSKENSIGVGGDVVLQLSDTLPAGKNYKLFADNFFTSLPLVKALKERSIFFAGTVRANRLKGCHLKSEKELKRQGRGASDYSIHQESNTIAI